MNSSKKLIILDFSTINSKDDLHDYLQNTLHLPKYYGRNLDALNDCLSEIKSNMNLILKNKEHLKTCLGEYADFVFKVLENNI